MLVELLEAIHDLHQEVDTLLLPEDLVLLHVILKVSIVAVVNDQIIVVCCFKVFVKMKDIWVFDFTHDSHFCVKKSPQFGVLVDFLLSDCFNSKYFIGLLLCCLEHCSELPLAKF